MLFVTKSLPVTAVQWFKLGDHPSVVAAEPGFKFAEGTPAGSAVIPTLEGPHVVQPGAWILGPGARGEYWAMQADIFSQTYEPFNPAVHSPREGITPDMRVIEKVEAQARYSHKQVLVLRKDLNMRKGKMVAQGAHGSVAGALNGAYRQGNCLVVPLDERNEPWLVGRFPKICVSASSEEELLEIHRKAQEAGLTSKLIKDAGFTEFHGVPTYTSVSVGPDFNEKVDAITGHLPLL